MVNKFSSIILVLLSLVAAVNGQVVNTGKEPTRTEKNPVNYGLVVDNSGSYRMIFTEVINSVNEIIEANNPDDETFLVRFVDSDKITLLQDFTSSKEDLRSAADEMFIEGGQTAILDSVYFSAKHLAEKNASPSNKRKVLILITDGEDRKSATKIEEVLKFLKDEKIQVYTLGLSDGKIYKSLLEKLAKETGGKSFMVEKRPDLKNIVNQLTLAVRAQ